jgi:hypothetical protein
MTQEAEALLRRIVVVMGWLLLASVAIEAVLATVVGNPIRPPFSTPETRFQLVAGLIPRLAELVTGLALITAGYWNGKRLAVERRVGWLFVILAALVLAPLIILIAAFQSQTLQMPPAGRLRFQVQFVRALIFYPTLAVTLFVFGRVLLRNSTIRDSLA